MLVHYLVIQETKNSIIHLNSVSCFYNKHRTHSNYHLAKVTKKLLKFGVYFCKDSGV